MRAASTAVTAAVVVVVVAIAAAAAAAAAAVCFVYGWRQNESLLPIATYRLAMYCL